MCGKLPAAALVIAAALSLACSLDARAQQGREQPNTRGPSGVPIERLREQLQRELEQMQLDLELLQRDFGRGRLPPRGVRAGWGGVQLQKVTPDLQEKLGLPENEGLLIASVEPRSVADKAGIQARDILVKVNGTPVPADIDGLAKILRDQKSGEAMTLVVLRAGKEESIQGVPMPALVTAGPALPGQPRFMGRPGGVAPRPPGREANGNRAAPLTKIDHLSLEMTVHGAKVIRKQTAEQFSGEYSKGELKITMGGKFDNGLPRITEIKVMEGRDTKTYTRMVEVPIQQRFLIQQMLMPSMGHFGEPPLMGNFPGFPQILDFDGK